METPPHHSLRNHPRLSGLIRPAPFDWHLRLRAVVAQAWRRFERRRRLARDIATLHDMEDRLLRDIGLDRWEIDYLGRPGPEPAPPPRTMSQQRFIVLIAMIAPAMAWIDHPVRVLAATSPAWLTGGAGLFALVLVMMSAPVMLASIAGRPLRSGRRLQGAVLVLGSLVASLAMAWVFKHLIGRARPMASDGDPLKFAPFAFDDRFASLPSAQATCAAAIAFSLAASLPQLRAALLLLGAVACLTRVLVDAHWFSDVMAGWTLGAAAVAAVSHTTERWACRSGAAR